MSHQNFTLTILKTDDFTFKETPGFCLLSSRRDVMRYYK